MWCLRLNSPFGWLILSKAKPLETRRDFNPRPKQLPRLKPGELVLVFLDDQAFPPNGTTKQRENIELGIAELLSRQNMETNSGPTKEQLGSICGWIRIGKSYPLNEQTGVCLLDCRVEDRVVTLARRLPIIGKPRCGVWRSAGALEREYAYSTAGWRTELYSNVSVPQADVFVGCHMRLFTTQNNNK